jgi:hypothetical protein
MEKVCEESRRRRSSSNNIYSRCKYLCHSILGIIEFMPMQYIFNWHRDILVNTESFPQSSGPSKIDISVMIQFCFTIQYFIASKIVSSQKLNVSKLLIDEKKLQSLDIVHCRNITTLLKALDIVHIDWWILDVEGGELEVLNGWDPTKVSVDVITIEDIGAGGPVNTKKLKKLISLGYECSISRTGFVLFHVIIAKIVIDV